MCSSDLSDEDGYSIVADYLASLSKKSLDIRNGEIRRLENDRYSGDDVAALADDLERERNVLEDCFVQQMLSLQAASLHAASTAPASSGYQLSGHILCQAASKISRLSPKR